MSARGYLVVQRLERGRSSFDEALVEADELVRASGEPHTVALALTTLSFTQTNHCPNPPVTDEELP